MNKRRIIIVGLDGVPYDLLLALAGDGTMPNIARLLREGTCGRMASSLPEISSVAWSSIITGKNPGEHGIFGFTDITEGTYKFFFPNYSSLKAQPFWQRPGYGKSVVINVPSTYPAAEMNGVIIAGFVALDLARATYPPSLVPKLKEMGYRIDIDLEHAAESSKLLLSDLNTTLDARIRAYRYLWDQEKWDNFMLVFTGTDRLMHFLWNAYEDSNHSGHNSFLGYFSRVDEIIGEIMEKSNDEDSIMVLSDHGFERLDKDVYLNAALRKGGMLAFDREPPESLQDIAAASKAFVLDPGRIYLHYQHRFPGGSVSEKDSEATLKELEELFYSLEVDRKKVIKRCYRKEEIYSGTYLPQAPDMVLLSNSGFNLRGGIKTTELSGKEHLTGKHTQPDAFLLVRGLSQGITLPERLNVTHIVDIMDHLKQQP